MVWNPPPPLAIALAFMRSSAGWSRERMAEVGRTTRKKIGEWESGHRRLSRRRAESLAGLLGFSPADLDEVLAEVARRRAQSAAGASAPGRKVSEKETAIAQVGVDLAAFLTEELALLARRLEAEEERTRAGKLWEELSKRSPAARRALVEREARFESWALAWRLGEESERAASDRADRAVELAELGLLAAERARGLTPAPDRFRALLLSGTWAFVGNARRVAGQLPLAREAFHRSEKLAEEGEGGDPDRFLDPSRRLDLEASLRKHLGQLPEALDLLDRALAMGAEGEARGRLLLKKAFALEQGGEPEKAIASLLEAAPWVDRTRDPRQYCVLRFNLIVNLCHLERFGEAAVLLPEVRAIAIEQRGELDLVRVVWLEGRTRAGLGDREEGARAIAQVFRDFKHLGIEYDAGLAALELAALRIETGHPAEARGLADDLLPLFRAQGVDRELLAALSLWVEAARRESASADAARDLLRRLERRRPLERAEAEEQS